MTIKVMLAEDELLVRLGIKSLIEWEKHGFTFIGDAADGVKALELMDREAPDILLTDILMPRMDGLELIEKVRKRYPDTLIIVLSSHNEFDYVRRAMKLGVEDYILKTSMKPAELLQILLEASGKIAKRREMAVPADGSQSPAQCDREAILQRLCAELEQDAPPEAGEAGGTDRLKEDKDLPPGSFFIILQPKLLREGVEEQSAMRMLSHLFESELGDLLVCSPVETDGEVVLLLTGPGGEVPDIDALAEKLTSAARRMLGISLDVGSSGRIADWHGIAKAYAQAKQLLAERRVQETDREDINRLLDYMKAHYAEDLSLKKAAEMIRISESYLSFVFKKETGIGFTDYLNTLRADKAAHYLVNTDMPAYQIALEVGYENINYFGRIFKKIKGVSPQKYRAQFK